MKGKILAIKRVSRGTIIKLRETIRIRPEEFGGLAFDSERSRIHEVNEAGFYILQIIEKCECTIQDLVKKLCSKYNISKKIAKADVISFMKELEKRKIAKMFK